MGASCRKELVSEPVHHPAHDDSAQPSFAPVGETTQVQAQTRTATSIAQIHFDAIPQPPSRSTLNSWSSPDLYKSRQEIQGSKNIPRNLFEQNTILPVIITRVIDGDTVDCRHTLERPFTGRVDTSDRRRYNRKDFIRVRVYAVDAPETAKPFGSPLTRKGQPFGEETKRLVQNALEGKFGYLKLLGRDRYNRVLGKVSYIETVDGVDVELDISETLMLAGLVVLYRGRGADYDGDKQKLRLVAMEEYAQEQKLGMWGADSIQTPGEFKRLKRQAKGQTQERGRTWVRRSSETYRQQTLSESSRHRMEKPKARARSQM